MDQGGLVDDDLQQCGNVEPVSPSSPCLIKIPSTAGTSQADQADQAGQTGTGKTGAWLVAHSSLCVPMELGSRRGAGALRHELQLQQPASLGTGINNY